jgi:hypothetical protein
MSVAVLADHRREKLLAALRDQRSELLNIHRSMELLQEAIDPLIDEIERVFSWDEWHRYDQYLDELWDGTKKETNFTFGALDQAIRTLEYSLSSGLPEEVQSFIRSGIADKGKCR